MKPLSAYHLPTVVEQADDSFITLKNQIHSDEKLILLPAGPFTWLIQHTCPAGIFRQAIPWIYQLATCRKLGAILA